MAVIFQQMTSGMNVFSFLAIPFFIFAGELMLLRRHRRQDRRLRARASSATCAAASACRNVVACTLFGGVSGSPVADVSAMGAVMIPMMKREGYDADYAVNVTTHAALVGALMPTSHNMIIYSLAAGGKVSIGALIARRPAAGAGADGLQPGRGLPRRGQARLSGAARFPGWADRARARFAAALPGLLIVVIILGGILSGVFTATESAAVAVLYALAADVRRLPHADVGAIPEGRGQGGARPPAWCCC